MNQKQNPTTPGIPKRSPILVLTGPDATLLRGSDENRCIQHGMVVGSCFEKVAVLMKSLQKFHFDLFRLTHNKALNSKNIIDRELSILIVVKTHPRYCQNNKLIIFNNVSIKMH